MATSGALHDAFLDELDVVRPRPQLMKTSPTFANATGPAEKFNRDLAESEGQASVTASLRTAGRTSAASATTCPYGTLVTPRTRHSREDRKKRRRREREIDGARPSRGYPAHVPQVRREDGHHVRPFRWLKVPEWPVRDTLSSLSGNLASRTAWTSY